MREEYVPADANGVRRNFFNRSVSWSAIIAGLVVTLVIQVLLTMLGVAIGAATIEPLQERNPVDGLGTGAGIWWFVTALIALFVGAFVAGRLQGVASKKEGRLHGFLMWSTATMFTFMVAGTMMGGVFATGFSAISQPGNRKQLMNEFEENKGQMGMRDQNRTGFAADYADANDTRNDLRSDAGPTDNRVSPANPYRTPATDETLAQNTADSAAAGSVDRGDNNQTGGNTNLLNRGDDPAKANQVGDDVARENRVVAGSQEEARLRETGEEVADTTSKAALMGLLVLLMGAGVCTWAGSKGAPHDFVPKHERDVRVPTGAIPGEPLKG